MQQMNPVAIDNDFLNHLLGIKNHTDLEHLIKRFFVALQVRVSMHRMVYDHEAIVLKNSLRDSLIADSTISIVELDSIWNGISSKKKYYEIIVKEIYKDFTGIEYPCNNFFNDWKAQSSLGEVHTVVMCALLTWDCFLSDDKQAASKLQVIASRKLNWPVNIYSRANCCAYLKDLSLEERQGLNSNDLKKLSHTSSH